MELSFTTPALLFPAISLLLLAYTNRFLALAALARDLTARHHGAPSARIRSQIENLRQRLVIIRNMQIFGVSSFFLCALCMFVLFIGQVRLGHYIFGISLLALLTSLALSLREILVSIDALQIQLQDLEE